MLDVGSLFSGIGGFDLGLERAGMRVVWQCEQDEYCRRVLAKHWPGVPCYPDVRTLVGNPHVDDGGQGRPGRSDPTGTWQQQPNGSLHMPVRVPQVDVLCGGFPCQDLSAAGKGAGLDGERSRLWYEYLRVIRELRPRYVIVENVPRLRKYLGTVIGGLADAGYDAEWTCISAADVGAPHLRKRLWIVAYPQRHELRQQPRRCRGEDRPGASLASVDGEARPLADTAAQGLEGHEREAGQPQVAEPRFGGASLADARGVGWWPGDEEARDTGSHRHEPCYCGAQEHTWSIEPDVGRVAHGVPARVDRLRALGNALVPQIAEWIGHRITEYECLSHDES